MYDTNEEIIKLYESVIMESFGHPTPPFNLDEIIFKGDTKDIDYPNQWGGTSMKTYSILIVMSDGEPEYYMWTKPGNEQIVIDRLRPFFGKRVIAIRKNIGGWVENGKSLDRISVFGGDMHEAPPPLPPPPPPPPPVDPQMTLDI